MEAYGVAIGSSNDCHKHSFVSPFGSSGVATVAIATTEETPTADEVGVATVTTEDCVAAVATENGVAAVAIEDMRAKFACICKFCIRISKFCIRRILQMSAISASVSVESSGTVITFAFGALERIVDGARCATD